MECVDFLSRYHYAFGQDADHLQFGEVVVDNLSEQRRYYRETVLLGVDEH